ncbi:hypothetical protein KKD52_15250 [Myxococcota bacterium]|nr:hypothetical protein [Myxococcota bacterium]
MMRIPSLLLVFLLLLASCAGGAKSKNNNNFNAVNANNANNINNGDFGKSCTVIQECVSEHCVPFSGPNDTRCTILCDAQDCPNNFLCRPATRDAGADDICLPASLLTCNTCVSDNDCGLFSDRCVETGLVKGCLADCSVGAGCPSGQVCTPGISVSGVAGNFCKPSTGTCDCSEANVGVMIECTTESAHGICDGHKTCQGAAGWTACDAPLPIAEVCDGFDNNCNDQTDEGVLGTIENCASCGDACPGGDLPGTHADCTDNACRLFCETDYYDSDQQDFNGCECADDTQGGTSVSGATTLGSFEDCDFSTNVGSWRVPVDATTIAHSDYFKYNYNNTSNFSCWAYNYVRVSVPSGSTPMQLCGGSATNETGWSCVTASPGGSANLEMLPLPGNGDSTVMYFRVRNMTNQAAPGCGDYSITIYDNGDL